MQSMRHFAPPSYIRHLHLKYLLILVSVLLMMPQAHAVVVENLYAVEVPVVDQTAATRRVAFKKGLSEVLIRVTGDRNIFSLIKLPYSSSYVKQFQYHEAEIELEPAVGDATDDLSDQQNKPTQILWIQYNETKVKEFVRSNALPLWGKLRSESIIWIAVNDGVNRYVLKSGDTSILKTIVGNAANRRAVPVLWPKIDPQERAIRFADVWAGFYQPIKDASGTKNADSPIIIGRLSWEGERWKSNWSLLLEGNNVDWAIEHADYNEVIVEAIETAADLMGQQFALFDTGDINSFHAIDIVIKDIDSVVALNRVKKYLSTMPLVQTFNMNRIENDQVFFNVSLRTNAEDFISFIETDATLIFLPDEEEKISGLKPLLRNEVDRAQAKTADYKFQLQP